MHYRISKENALLAAICMVDMLLTILLVQCRLATEHNPIMAACLSRGVGTFAAVKLISFIPFIVVAEIHRRRNPLFVRAASRCAIFLYLGLYATFFVRANLLA